MNLFFLCTLLRNHCALLSRFVVHIAPKYPSIRGLKKMMKEDMAKARKTADDIIRNTYRTLMTRGMKGCYIYCTDSNLADYIESCLDLSQEQQSEGLSLLDDSAEVQKVRIEPDVNDDVKFVDYLPYYSIKAACGAFGDYQDVEPMGWVQAKGVGQLRKNMFVVKANGHSMEPLISDGDLCIFRTNVVGSRSQKVVLVQHHSYMDPETGGRFSIKKYSSEKRVDPETGEWEHERIVLNPLNKEYDPIVIEEEDGYMVIGEFLGKVMPDSVNP